MYQMHPEVGTRRVDVDELVEAYERCADDPDAPVTMKQRGLLLTGALNGAAVGLTFNGAPTLISINGDFLRGIPHD